MSSGSGLHIREFIEGGEGAAPTRNPVRTAAESTRKAPREESPAVSLETWLVRGGIVTAVALAAIALLAPNGILWWRVALDGPRHGAGAGRLRGRSLRRLPRGLPLRLPLYAAFPLYTAYYIVTRWDDLWTWFAGSTVGVGLVLLGTEMVRWSGALG